MRPTVFQKAEIRDENDVIVQQGTYGKGSALSNSTNDGWVDYVMNNLEALYGIAKDEVVPVPSLPASGQTNKTYLLTTTGVSYRWSGTEWVAVSSSEAVGRAETAANLAEQWATKTDGIVADNEYSAKYYANASQQSADDAQDVADDMATHLAQIDQNTGGVSANSKRIGNIEKLLQGNLYDYDTDDDTAYAKSVPAGAMPYAGLEKVGGKTIVMNQLLPQVVAGSGYSFNRCSSSFDVESNTLTLTCTSNQYNEWSYYRSDTWVIVGHKYYVHIEHKIQTTNTPTLMFIVAIHNLTTPQQDTWVSDSLIATATNSTSFNPSIRYANASDVTVGDKWIIKNLMLIDLTLMFGAGNEPSTVAEFESMFPADYYAYNEGTLLSAGVTEVVSDGYNHVNETYLQSQWTYADGVYSGSISPIYLEYNSSIDQTWKPNTAYHITADVGFFAGYSEWLRWQVHYTDGTMQESNSSSNQTGFDTISITTNPNKTIDYVRWYINNGYAGKFKNIIVREANPLQTISIPTAIRNLEGYGWSAGTAYNYVDFERKVFVQNVGRIHLGTATWGRYGGFFFINYSNFSPLPKKGVGGEYCNVVMPRYEQIVSQHNLPVKDKAYYLSDDGGFVLRDDSFSNNETALKASLAGIYLYYELGTPIEVDISEYLTDDNLINVEAGGTLTFENQHGDDYRLPVPSEETYMIDLQEAINNG